MFYLPHYFTTVFDWFYGIIRILDIFKILHLQLQSDQIEAPDVPSQRFKSKEGNIKHFYYV